MRLRGLNVGSSAAMEGRRLRSGGDVDDPWPPASQPEKCQIRRDRFSVTHLVRR